MEYPIKALFWKLPFLGKKTIRIVPLPKMGYISNYTSTFIPFFFISFIYFLPEVVSSFAGWANMLLSSCSDAKMSLFSTDDDTRTTGL